MTSTTTLISTSSSSSSDITIWRCSYCKKLSLKSESFCQGPYHQWRHSRCCLNIVFSDGNFLEPSTMDPNVIEKVFDLLSTQRGGTFLDLTLSTCEIPTSRPFDSSSNPSLRKVSKDNEKKVDHQQQSMEKELVHSDEEERADNQGDLCVICYDKERNHAAYPCGHMILCDDCVVGRGCCLRSCPICRKTMLSTMRIFR